MQHRRATESHGIALGRNEVGLLLVTAGLGASNDHALLSLLAIRHCASRIMRRVAGHAGIDKPVGPHTLRHAFITAALDAGGPLRDDQEAASHAGFRATLRPRRVSPDRHATYIAAAYLAGAAR